MTVPVLSIGCRYFAFRNAKDATTVVQLLASAQRVDVQYSGEGIKVVPEEEVAISPITLQFLPLSTVQVIPKSRRLPAPTQ
jgi:hypothetical protein